MPPPWACGQGRGGGFTKQGLFETFLAQLQCLRGADPSFHQKFLSQLWELELVSSPTVLPASERPVLVVRPGDNKQVLEKWKHALEPQLSLKHSAAPRGPSEAVAQSTRGQ